MSQSACPPILSIWEHSLSAAAGTPRRDWKSGQKRYWTEIFVHDLTLLGGGRGENGGSTHSNGRDDSRRSSGGSGYQRQGMEGQYADEELNPDEIPF